MCFKMKKILKNQLILLSFSLLQFVSFLNNKNPAEDKKAIGHRLTSLVYFKNKNENFL